MKQRLVGAAVLMALGVIFIPIFLAPEEAEISVDNSIKIERREQSGEFSSKVLPIEDGVVDSITEISEREPQRLDRAALPPEVGQEPANGNPDEAGSNQTALSNEQNGVQPTERIGMTAWVVQAGSFSSKENAEKLVARLRTKAYSAYIDEIPGEKASFRVRIGPLLSKARAEQTVASLQKALKIDGMILKYQ